MVNFKGRASALALVAALALPRPGGAVPPQLAPEPPGPAARSAQDTEWFGLEIGLTVFQISSCNSDLGSCTLRPSVIAPGPLLNLRGPTLKWEHLYLTLVEAGVGVGMENLAYVIARWGATVGYPLSLGPGGRHQFKLGLGVGGAYAENAASLGSQIANRPANYKSAAFTLAPTFRYDYRTRGRLSVGYVLRANFAVVASGDPMYERMYFISNALSLSWSGR